MSTTKTELKRFPFKWGAVQLSGQAAVDGEYSSMDPPNQWVLEGTNSFTGEELPNWKSLISQGLNATTVASGKLYEVQTHRPYEARAYGYVSGPVNPPPASYFRRSRVVGPHTLSFGTPGPHANVTAALNDARSKFAKEVEKIYTLFNGGLFLGELREVLRMIRSPAKSLREGLQAYLNNLRHKRGRLRKLPYGRRERAVQASWLEYSFGWSPFISDLEDASKYLKRRYYQLQKELVEVGPVVASRVWSASQQRELLSGIHQIYWKERRRRTATAVLAGAVSSRALGPNLLDSSTLGLSIRSFAPTLWELVPWSFLIDYFTNVGDVILGWSNQSLELAWGRETQIDEVITDLVDFVDTDYPGFTYLERSFEPGVTQARVKTFARNSITTPPIPGFYYEIPGFGVKWLNMAALFTARRDLSTSLI